jgi:hypothetical protein
MVKKIDMKNLIDRVDDAFNYFNGFRLEELKTDDQYYINALMFYIEKLEAKLNKLNK